MSDTDVGRVPSEPGSCPSDQDSLARLDAPRVDPSRDKPFSFDELVEPVLEALRFAYVMERKNRGRNIPWKGPGLGKDMRANCPDFAERFKAGNLRYSEEDQGRDAVQEIVGAAIQLGIEQGRRITLDSPEINTLRIKLETAQLALTRLGGMGAFHLSRVIDPERDAELLARIDYARKFGAAIT